MITKARRNRTLPRVPCAWAHPAELLRSQSTAWWCDGPRHQGSRCCGAHAELREERKGGRRVGQSARPSEVTPEEAFWALSACEQMQKISGGAPGLMSREGTPRQGETWRESRWQGHMGSPHQLCFSHLFAMLCTFLRVCDGAWRGCDRKGHQSKEERKKEDSRRKASRGQGATLLAYFQHPCASPIAL